MKKSFILHIDSLSILKKMPDDIAGKFIKILYEYNKTGVVPDMDFALEMAVTPFLNQFCRDGEKYKKTIERNKINGSRGGRPRNPQEAEKPNGLLRNPLKPKKADSDSDSDSDSDNDSDNDNIKSNILKDGFSFRKSLTALGVDKNLIDDFFRNRKLKRLANTETAFKRLKIELQKSGKPINLIFEIIASNGWGGFKSEWLTNLENKNNNKPAKKMSLAEKIKLDHGIS